MTSDDSQHDRHIAWEAYWNGWNDCADVRFGVLGSFLRTLFNRNHRDGGPNKPLDPEEG